MLECVLRLAPNPREDRSDRVDAFLTSFDIAVPAIDEPQLRLARAGFIAFGKGRHPAGLNFGDCFAYALAKHRGAPLLYVREDFSKTDLESALA